MFIFLLHSNMGIFTPCIVLSLIVCICSSYALSDDSRKAYIVYMGSLPKEVEYMPSSHHLKILQSVLVESTIAEDSIIRSYGNSFNGFAAKLTEIEKQKLSRLEGVVSIFPDRSLKLQTTRSWDFMGFPENIRRNKIIESDIIIGLLDTGVWPESKSFSDEGFGPIPSKWKGQCPPSFPCNKKLIGGKNLLSIPTGPKAPRDFDGHGSHTASIAAGNVVHGTNFYGIAEGSARGAVPSSRIAAYQVCKGGCSESDILAGFDIAIKDGVDIISISIGHSGGGVEFYSSSISIGAFHAMEKGILTVQSGDNTGPSLGSTSSLAPWLFSVAASSIDRHIVSNTILGNGQNMIGNAINSNALEARNYSLVYGKDATSTCSPMDASTCFDGCLDTKLVKGKIVICDGVLGFDEAARAGAAGAIRQSFVSNVSSIYPLTVSILEPIDYYALQAYYKQSKSPVVSIQKTEAIKDSFAPVVAPFSSRGPNTVARDILKPDITAPGVAILAAYSPMAHLTTYAQDKRSVNYSIMSGTSMACPHVAGASAYVKSFHPTWSPSAIKSALMTTAWEMNVVQNPNGEFGYGSGHIDPVKAVDPGLVYDSDTNDYVNFMCKMGYNATMIELVTGHKITCTTSNVVSKNFLPVDMNYPSMAAASRSSTTDFTVEFQRTVTNVGRANSTYNAIVTSSSNIKVTVQPSFLSFESLDEKKSFNVSVEVRVIGNEGRETASLTWFDGFHKVRSPIVIYNRNITQV